MEDEMTSGNNGKILVIGDRKVAFKNDADLAVSDLTFCHDMLEGTIAAASGGYSKVAVVCSDSFHESPSALRALRKHCSGKIVMLASMYQEPFVRGLINNDNGNTLFDDYLICPVSVEQLFEPLSERNVTKAAFDEQTARHIEELERLATTDELTGLKNRRYMWEFARQIIEKAKIEGGQVTLLIFDIDNFKHYNDMYGHVAGDAILRQAALLMKRSCRTHDIVGRVGGDEFVVIFWDRPKNISAQTPDERRLQSEHPREPIFIADRFRSELKDSEFNELGKDGKGVLTISGGLASFPKDGDTVDILFAKADQALLGAKKSGKNRIYLVGENAGDIAQA